VTGVVAAPTLKTCFVVGAFAQFAQRSRVAGGSGDGTVRAHVSMQPGSRFELLTQQRNRSGRGLVLTTKESHARRLSERFDSVDDRWFPPLILLVSPTT